MRISDWSSDVCSSDLLTSIGRGTGARNYHLLKGALTRLQSTVVRTTIRYGEHWRRQQFSWINEWEELVTRQGRIEDMEFELPDWIYQGVQTGRESGRERVCPAG